MRIRAQLVPASIAATVTYAGTSRRVGITIHETANTASGATAAAHANLQSAGNSRQASWHWQVDDTEAVQSFPHTARCWHAGSGTAGDGDDTVAIEICVNDGGNYVQAVRNAAELVRHIRATDPAVGGLLAQHNRWSGKDCPDRLRAGSHGITWPGFLALTANPTTNTEDDMNAEEHQILLDMRTTQLEDSAVFREYVVPAIRDIQDRVASMHAAGFQPIREGAPGGTLAWLDEKLAALPERDAAAVVAGLLPGVVASIPAAFTGGTFVTTTTTETAATFVPALEA